MYNQLNGKKHIVFANIVDDLFNSGLSILNNSDSLETLSRYPKMNIKEIGQKMTVEFLIPGIDKEDVKIEINQNLLTVSYEKQKESKVEGEQSLLTEFSISSFKRSIKLKDTFDTDKIEAKYNNGVLMLNIPKKEEITQQKKVINII